MLARVALDRPAVEPQQRAGSSLDPPVDGSVCTPRTQEEACEEMYNYACAVTSERDCGEAPRLLLTHTENIHHSRLMFPRNRCDDLS